MPKKKAPTPEASKPKEVTLEVTDPYMRKRGINTVILSDEPDTSQKGFQKYFASLFTTIYRKEIMAQVLNIPVTEEPKPQKKAPKKKPG